MTQPTASSQLSRARKAFLAMASPFGFGADNKLFNSPAAVNLPPKMGRADAAFEFAVKIMEDSSFMEYSDSARLLRYSSLRDLFACARENSEALSLLSRRMGKKVSFSELAACFEFMERVSGILYDLLRNQTEALHSPHKVFADFFRRMESDSADPELELFRMLKNFYFENKTLIADLRTKFRNLLPAHETERYQKSYDEYVRCYGELAARLAGQSDLDESSEKES